MGRGGVQGRKEEEEKKGKRNCGVEEGEGEE